MLRVAPVRCPIAIEPPVWLSLARKCFGSGDGLMQTLLRIPGLSRSTDSLYLEVGRLLHGLRHRGHARAWDRMIPVLSVPFAIQNGDMMGLRYLNF